MFEYSVLSQKNIYILSHFTVGVKSLYDKKNETYSWICNALYAIINILSNTIVVLNDNLFLKIR